MKIITKRPNGTKKVVTQNDEPTLCQQQWQASCNVNNIMKKYKKTGTVTHVRNATAGVYQDLTKMPSYEEAVQTVTRAEQAFQEVPALVRKRFDNNPQKMIDFLNDPKNQDEAIKLGLAKLKPVDPVVVEIKKLNETLKTEPKK